MDAIVYVRTPLRGPGQQEAAEFKLTRFEFTESWGAQPASAVCEFVRETVAAESIRLRGVVVGSYVYIAVAGATYHGICKSCQPLDSSSGKTMVLEFVDMREFLTWDCVFGA